MRICRASACWAVWGPCRRLQSCNAGTQECMHAQRFSLLGSTGSIGTQTLDIAREHSDRFEIVALAAGGNVKLLAEQVRGPFIIMPMLNAWPKQKRASRGGSGCLQNGALPLTITVLDYAAVACIQSGDTVFHIP